MLDMFREITGDENPMHTDDTYAKKQGYESRIAYGMLTASLFNISWCIPAGKVLYFQEYKISFNKRFTLMIYFIFRRDY